MKMMGGGVLWKGTTTYWSEIFVLTHVVTWKYQHPFPADAGHEKSILPEIKTSTTQRNDKVSKEL